MRMNGYGYGLVRSTHLALAVYLCVLWGPQSLFQFGWEIRAVDAWLHWLHSRNVAEANSRETHREHTNLITQQDKNYVRVAGMTRGQEPSMHGQWWLIFADNNWWRLNIEMYHTSEQ